MKKNDKIFLAVWCSLLVAVLLLASLASTNPGPESNEGAYSIDGVKYFDSESEMEDFLGKSDGINDSRDDAVEANGLLTGGGLFSSSMTVETSSAPESADMDGASYDSQSGSTSFSKVNNQVEGVHEPDLVITDGSYIYKASNNQNYYYGEIAVDDSDSPRSSGSKVQIIRAYPAESAEVVSEIELEGGGVIGMFINGNHLTVIENDYHEEMIGYNGFWGEDYYYNYNPLTKLSIYDVRVHAAPILRQNVTADGNYMAARMIGDHVYLMTSYYIYEDDGDYILPAVESKARTDRLSYRDIGYFDESEGSKQLSLVMGLKLDSPFSPQHTALLLSHGHQLAVFENSIYMAGMSYEYYNGWISDGYRQESVIHKLAIEEGKAEYVGSAIVPGRIHNQFSMDEHDGYFRVATTEGWGSWDGGNSQNNLYVMDENMSRIGELEGLAEGEQIYSARFVGERGYLVTFKTIDPFFVIDLSNPRDPKVLGFLKIPGFSDYMHPYDENHIIGVGLSTEEAQSGDFAWFQGLKLSLFDVTDPDDPKETSKIIIGDRGTSSDAQHDHKAFLFAKPHGLIVLPVDLYENDDPYAADSSYGQWTWQGAYAISVNPEDGFEIKGRIGHGVEEDNYYGSWGSDKRVTRSLYIDDVLYTISDAMIKMNDINDLEAIKTLEL